MGYLSLTKGQRTRDSLIEAAFELLTQNGYHGTSMRMIAEKAGLTVAGIYNHFANKEDIIKAVILTYHPFITVLPKLVESEGQTAEALLRHATHIIIAQIEETPGIFNLLFIEMVELEGRHLPEIAEILLPQIGLFLQEVMQTEGQFRTESPFVILRSFISLLLGYLVTQRLLNNAPNLPIAEVDLDALLNVYLYGILQKESEQT